MEDCKLLQTTLAFEYAERIDAEVSSRIDSIKNPRSGKITVQSAGEIILDPQYIDPSKTVIATRDRG